jgi:predicted ester cyclase
MTTLENREVVRRFFDEFMNERKLDKVEDYVTRNWVNHDPSLTTMEGYEGARQLVRTLTGGFPDMKIRIEDIIAEGDRIAVRFSFVGTHKGDFMGAAATGKKVNASACGIFRVQDGRLAENWVVFDALGLAKQIGMIPEMERASQK